MTSSPGADGLAQSRNYEVPGDNIDLHVTNTGIDSVTISYALLGRTN